jgi:prepilin-type processing-associated H-X9-DG protein
MRGFFSRLIIAILAAILFPVFAKAREKARQSKCLNNQRQIVVAIQMWAQDHEETYPSEASIWADINVEKGITKCPSVSRGDITYVYNYRLGRNGGRPINAIADPAGTMVTADGKHLATANPKTYDYVAYAAADIDKSRHLGSAICSFVDGHVEVANKSADEILGTGNLVKNPGFENKGDFWTSNGTGTLSWEATDKVTGSFAARLNSTGTNTFSLWQDVPVTPGVKYKFSCLVKYVKSSGNGMQQLGGFYDKFTMSNSTAMSPWGTYSYLTATTTGDAGLPAGWSKLSTTGITAPEGAERINILFRNYQCAGDTYIDDVYFGEE